MSTVRQLCVVGAVFALMATACGGGSSSDDGSTAAVDSSTPDASDDTSGGDATDSEPDAPADEPDPGGGDVAVSDRPDPLVLVPFADPPSAPVTPVTGATVEQHIGAMFAVVVDLVLADDRGLNGRMVDAFYYETARGIPEVVLSVIAGQASLGSDVLSTIEAYSRAGALAAYGPEATEYFEVRARAAAGLAEQNQAVYDAVVAGRELDILGRACLAEAFADEPDDCSDNGPAEAIVAELIDTLDVDVELPDDFDDDIGRVVDLCVVFADATGAVSAEDRELFDLIVDDTILDGRFIGRSECRYSVEDLDEDPVWDAEPGRAAFATLYGSLIDAGAATGFDEDFYDDAPEDEYRLGVRDTIIAHSTAAAETVAMVIDTVEEPFARLSLLSIGVLGAEEAWFQTAALERGGAEGVLIDLVFECFGLGSEDDPLSGCDAATLPYTEHVIVGGSDDYGFTGYSDSIDWDDVEDIYDHCSVWTDLASAQPEAVAEAVDFQMGQIGLDRPFGLNDCR